MRCMQTGDERILQPRDIPDYSGKIRGRISDLQAERTASAGIRSGRFDLKNVTGVHWGRSFLALKSCKTPSVYVTLYFTALLITVRDMPVSRLSCRMEIPE